MQSPQDPKESVTVKEVARCSSSSTRQATRFIQNGEKNSCMVCTSHAGNSLKGEQALTLLQKGAEH